MITPSQECPKSFKCPLLAPTLSWPLADRRIIFSLLLLLKHCSAYSPLLPALPIPTQLASPFLSLTGTYTSHISSAAALNHRKHTYNPGSVSHDLR